ncbi:c-type cytochrome [bacterium]|nr:c-type cytochrome [bacterium]
MIGLGTIGANLGSLPLALLDTDTTGMMPTQASSFAHNIDSVFGFIWWLCWFFFVLIIGGMVYLGVRFKGKPGDPVEHSPHHNMMLELTWSGIPLLLVVMIFWFTYQDYIKLRNEPLNSYEIGVTAQKWSWSFQYPNGWISDQLHVPAGQPIRLVMTSTDVIHSLFVPNFRIKQDVIPGRYTKLWFEARWVEDYEEAKEFPSTQRHTLFCTEYCGTKHSDMLAGVFVHKDRAGFDSWLADVSDLGKLPPEKAGEILYNNRGCVQCHSIDGKAGTGPTFKGLWGHEAKLKDGGTVLVDENYVRESVLDPQAKIVEGFQPVMPTYQGRLKDAEIGYLIAYLKTLK